MWNGVLDHVLVAFIGIYLVVAPYTKVEESFNLQAVHDFLYHGRDLASFDHVEFPGVVPRTSIGALALAVVARPFQWFGVPKPEMQLVVRGILGLASAAALSVFRRSIVKLYGPKRGKQTGAWFTLLLLGQFHMLFYASRTLPNMLALPLVLIAYAKFLGYEYTSSLRVLAFTAVVFRSELCILWACMAVTLLASRKLTLRSVFFAGLLGASVGSVLSIVCDSVFWGQWCFPELEGIFYNVVQGKSANWGTEPWESYFTVHLPNLLANPLVMILALIALQVTPRNLQLLFTASLAFVLIYSFQPHKELRFVIYVAPLWTALAARAIDYLGYAQGRKSVFIRGGWWISLGTALLMVVVAMAKLNISSLNYPGGVALELVNQGLEPNAKVHFDVTSCMTGVSRFGQWRDDVVYDKTEDNVEWATLNYFVGVDAPEAKDWDAVGGVFAFERIDRQAAVAAVKRAPGLLRLVLQPLALVDDLKGIWWSIIKTQPSVTIYKHNF